MEVRFGQDPGNPVVGQTLGIFLPFLGLYFLQLQDNLGGGIVIGNNGTVIKVPTEDPPFNLLNLRQATPKVLGYERLDFDNLFIPDCFGQDVVGVHQRGHFVDVHHPFQLFSDLGDGVLASLGVKIEPIGGLQTHQHGHLGAKEIIHLGHGDSGRVFFRDKPGYVVI
jgi:hypothetical protein